jgi:nicotinate-nucleotide adenylyltransferase
MQGFELSEVLAELDRAGEPRIEILRKAPSRGPRLGIFASSFNPPTLAHVEVVRLAKERFRLDEILALAGLRNADKTSYDCRIEDRFAMMADAFEGDAGVSLGISSHAFYVDMVEALDCLYPPASDLHFIIGFDTFERVIDLEDRYTARYHRRFRDRRAALEFLLSRSRLIVASRGGSGRESVDRILENEPQALRERVLYLDFPAELSERSATDVRERIGAGLPIDGLVPPAVQRYITDRQLYR